MAGSTGVSTATAHQLHQDDYHKTILSSLNKGEELTRQSLGNYLIGWIHSLAETDEYRDSLPIKHYASPEEISSIIFFFASLGQLILQSKYSCGWWYHSFNLKIMHKKEALIPLFLCSKLTFETR